MYRFILTLVTALALMGGTAHAVQVEAPTHSVNKARVVYAEAVPTKAHPRRIYFEVNDGSAYRVNRPANCRTNRPRLCEIAYQIVAERDYTRR